MFGRGNVNHIQHITSQDAFVRNVQLKSLGRYDLNKTVQRLEAMELAAESPAVVEGKTDGQADPSTTTKQSVMTAESAVEADSIEMKEIVVENLGAGNTPEQLRIHFGLDNTPFLTQRCSIELSDDNDQYSARLRVPEFVHTELLKLNGIVLAGRKLKVTSPEVDPAPPEQSETWSTHVELDFSVGRTVYEYKELSSAVIVAAVYNTFADDDTKRLIAPKRKDDTVWKIETKKIDLYKNAKFLQHEGAVLSDVQVKRVRTQVDVFGNVRRRNFTTNSPTDLLITLKDADTQKFEGVTDDMIFQKIVAMGIGRIKKAVRPQPHPGTDCPCGNKFFVLENVSEDDRKKIPPSFDFLINGWIQKMWLNYRGKPRRCKFCGEYHEETVKVCPKEAIIRQMERERDALKTLDTGLPMKTYTDSTMRLAEQKSLSSDIDAMSGASTGNLLNAMDVDPAAPRSAILIVAGQNDLHRRMENTEFAYMVQQKEKKLTEIAEKRNVALLSPPPLYAAREEFFHESLEKLSENKNIEVWKNPLDSFDDDGGRHPSPEQTVEILQYINSKTKEFYGFDYLLPSATPDTIVTKKYFGVTPLYRFGCSGCQGRKKNKWDNLCDDCIAAASTSPEAQKAAEKIEKRAEDIFDHQNPPLGADGSSSDGDDLACESCNVTFTNVVEIREHFRQHHGDEVQKNSGNNIRSQSKFSDDKHGRRQKSIPSKSIASS